MAIAYDTVVQHSDVSATSKTVAHTCTGSNLLLLVGITNWNAGDNVTGVTYNGVSMTRLARYVPNGTFNPIYVYYLYGPATGSNNVVISCTSSSLIQSASISFSGVKQTGFPDATNNSFSDTSTQLNFATTTSADNCWVGAFAWNNAGTFSAGSSTTMRGTGGDNNFFDNNAAKTPAGSVTLNRTVNTSAKISSIQYSFAPAPPATFKPRLLLI